MHIPRKAFGQWAKTAGSTVVTSLLLLISNTADAQAQGTSFREILLEALRSPKGTSSSYISGPVADQLRNQIGRSSATVLAEVSTVQALPQEGCKRLRMRITTPGTLLETTDHRQQMPEMFMELNMCANGQPPFIESEDPDDVAPTSGKPSVQ